MEKIRSDCVTTYIHVNSCLIHFTETQKDFSNDVLTFPYSETRPTGIEVSN